MTYLGQVQRLLLDVALVSHLSDDATKSIDLMNQLALGWPSHGWVARLPCNSIQIQSQQHGLRTHVGSCYCSFAASMARPHHNDIEVLLRSAAESLALQAPSVPISLNF